MKRKINLLLIIAVILALGGCSPKKPQEVVLAETEIEIEVGKTYQISATVKPDDVQDKTLKYEAADNSVCSVSESGLVTAKSAGETVIKVSCGEVSADLKVKVKKPIEVIAVYYNVIVDVYEVDYPTLTLYSDGTFTYVENEYNGLATLSGTYKKTDNLYTFTVNKQKYGDVESAVKYPEFEIMELNSNYMMMQTQLNMTQYRDILSKDKKVIEFETYYIDDPQRVSDEYRTTLHIYSDRSFQIDDNFFEGFEIVKGVFDIFEWPQMELNVTEKTNRITFNYGQIKLEETQAGLKLLTDLYIYKKGSLFSSFENHIDY